MRTRGRRDQGCASSRAGAEQANWQLGGLLAAARPVDDGHQARREQLQIEAVLGGARVDLLLLAREEID